MVTKLMSGGRIWSLDWSPNGTFIASGNATGLLRIYDVENMELEAILTGFKSTINGIHWSPDGKKIVASGPHDDPRIILWDLEQKTRIIIEAHKRQVRSVKWSPEGTYFASTSHDGTLRIWTPEGKFVKMFKGADFGCVGIDWLNEDTITASCWDNTIRTYSISGSESQVIENGNHRRKAVLAIDWHPSGELFATGEYGNEGDPVHALKLWSKMGELLVVKDSHKKEIRSLAWNKKGDLLATGGETVRLWTNEGKLLKVFKENRSPVWSLDWNLEGNRIASGHNDGKIRIWNTNGDLLSLLDGHSSEMSAYSFSTDSTQVLVGFSDGTLRHFNLDKLTSRTVNAHERSITTIAWSPDQQNIALGSNDGRCSIWGFQNNLLSKEATYVGNGQFIKDVAWNTDGSLVAYLQDHSIKVVSMIGNPVYETTIEANEVNSIAWNNGTAIGIKSEVAEYGSAEKIRVEKDGKLLGLVPLINNRFALLDDQNRIVYGDEKDFISLMPLENGFSQLKAID